MMILPLADTLQNCLQNLTSRIAGVDNEQMTNRAMGMGAMLGFSLGAIKEQFNSPSAQNNQDGSSSNGFKGFVNRAKSVVNPSMNLSDEKDYNGNINPIRNVIQKQSVTTNNTEKQNNTSNNKPSSSVATKIAKGGFNATKTYLSFGAKMTEGDFSKSPYKSSNNKVRKNNFQNTEYITKVADSNNTEKLGDANEPKG